MNIQFMKEVMEKFDALDKRIDYWQRDMERVTIAMEKHNEALEELLKVIKQ